MTGLFLPRLGRSILYLSYKYLMTELTEAEMMVVPDEIATLKIEHRDLDEIINRLADNPVQDDLQLRRLKRRKLLLKDQITLLERQLVPDVPA